MKSFLPKMLERNRGHIVTIASLAGKHGLPGLVDYCASKFAAVGFDESLRFELYTMGKTGVKTTAVCPFLTNTGMFDGADTGRYGYMCIMSGRHCFYMKTFHSHYLNTGRVVAVMNTPGGHGGVCPV